MRIAIYTLTSELHDEQAVSQVTREFLDSLSITFEFRGSAFADYGSHALDLIYIGTGGTEGLFLQRLPELQSQSDQPFYLLTSGKSNSLAASMEILSYLQQNGLQGEILHGPADYIAQRIALLVRVGEARRQLKGCRLGVVGAPSDWLIASSVDRKEVKRRLGIELVDVPMQELLDLVQTTPLHPATEKAPTEAIQQSLPVAEQLYDALRTLVARHHLQGFTIRCFDLLTAVHNTGCLALARLNAEGCVAGCEGDVPAMLSMAMAQALLGVSGFQANPASIDPATGTFVFAHCTIPLNMVERYELDTHFESGIGVGVRGFVKPGPVTIFKVSGDLSRCFIGEGEVLACETRPNLCRTQLVVRLSDPASTDYFLRRPIGNHHILLPGHCKALLQSMMGCE